MSSGSDGVYDAAVSQRKDYMAYTGIVVTGIITARGTENRSEAGMNEIKEFAGSR